MKIYTKTGDNGTTGLIGGKRVKKNNSMLEAYGTVDELNSYIGLIRSIVEDNDLQNFLLHIQDRLFTIGSLLACADISLRETLPQIFESNIENLERQIDDYNQTLPTLTNFILPGGSQKVAFCHVARTVCRRAERRVADLEEFFNDNKLILKYLNRLSDYLFILARKLTEIGLSEEKWKPKN